MDCSVETCTSPAKLKGMCRLHYHRNWRLGTPTPKFGKNVSDTPLAVRFWSFVEKTDDCWRWTGAPTTFGYGKLKFKNAPLAAHRVAYELLVGPIPEGMSLDHLCHTRDLTCPGGKKCPHRLCVNPEHLEPVSGRENRMRGRSFAPVNAAKTECIHGHPFDAANTYITTKGTRVCRACTSASQRAYQKRVRRKKSPG